MPAGISKAKARRNSKSKKKPGFQQHGLAKAGKRKVYTTGKRQVKSFPDGKTNCFIMAPAPKDGWMVHTRTDSEGHTHETGYRLNPQWKQGEPVWIPIN